jgi:hypothetical protein
MKVILQLVRIKVCFLEVINYQFKSYKFQDYGTLIWPLTSGFVRLIEIRASWSGHLS